MKNYITLPILIFVFSCAIGQSIDYETQIQPIFSNSCMPCHQGSNPSAGLDLTSYDNVMLGSSSGAVINIGDYQNSILWQEVSAGNMPNNIANNNLGIPDLTNDEVELIQNWILDLQCMVILCDENYQCVLGECVCINDADTDEVCDESDNCPNTWNPDQTDSDNDGIGDECDSTPLSIDETTKKHEVIKTVNLLGQEVNPETKDNTIIKIYQDGSVEKIKQIK